MLELLTHLLDWAGVIALTIIVTTALDRGDE